MVSKEVEFRVGSTTNGHATAHRGFVIGIDATNLRQGGGRTHLIELVLAADPPAHGVQKVIVWGGRETLTALDDRR